MDAGKELMISLAKKAMTCCEEGIARRLEMSWPDFEDWMNRPDDPYNICKKIDDLTKDARMLRNQPEFVRWCGSPKDAREWARLIARLAAGAEDTHSESRHPAFRDVDPHCKANLLNAHVVETLTRMGVPSPMAFPAEVRSSWDTKEFTPTVFVNPYAKTIGNIFFVLNVLWAFYAAHVRSVADNSDGSVFTALMCIEAGMFDLAATMIEVNEAFAPNISGFRRKVRADYKKWLTVIKHAAPFIGNEFQVSWMMDMVGIESDPSMAALRSFEPYSETVLA